MTRHQIARLVLILVIAVTISIGLGTIGRAAWVDHSTPAVATMCVLLGLFAVAVVVWAASMPVDASAQPWAVRMADLETTAILGAVGPTWPGGEPVSDDTEPILFTHEFDPVSRAHVDEYWTRCVDELVSGHGQVVRTPSGLEVAVRTGLRFGGVVTAADEHTMAVTASDDTEVRIGRHRGGTPVSELLQREGGVR